MAGDIVLTSVSSLQVSEQPTDVSLSNLTYFQKQRQALGLPFVGRQAAALYVSAHNNGKYSKGGHPAMAATIPENYDLSNEEAITTLIDDMREQLAQKIQLNGKLQIVNCIFIPGIDAVGNSCHGPSVSHPVEIPPLRTLGADKRLLAGPRALRNERV